MEFSKLIFLFFGLIALSKSKPTQDDLQIEVRELLNQYQMADATNEDPCPCIKATECNRILNLLEKAKELSKIHPERKEVINYIRNQTCDKENQTVRCCSLWAHWEPTSYGDKDSGTWKPQASEKECGNTLDTVSVIGGTETKWGVYPFMSLLGYSGNTRDTVFQCGGTVINKYYILTAAHCFLNKNPSVIALGEHDLENPTDGVMRRGVEKIILHEDYDPDLQGGAAPNDIALIRVNESIPFFYGDLTKSLHVSPICLPWKRNDPGRVVDSGIGNLTVIGWGYTSNNETERREYQGRCKSGSCKQQQLIVPFLDWQECNEKADFPPDFQVDRETLMCAGGEKGKDSCNGDSGGPLITRDDSDEIIKWFQVGIVSFGPKKCGNGIPGFYTKVAEFLPWIEKNLEP